MIDFAINYWEKLITALIEHIEIVLLSLIIAIPIAMLITILAIFWVKVSNYFISFFSLVYSIPSLALFAILIPIMGLGKRTAIFALIIYSQYILLNNFILGIRTIDKSIIESATGIGMSKLQVFTLIQLPLAKKSFITGIRLALISITGIATVAATINAGGLGTVLFDGLRTMNNYKIIWGSILAASLVLFLNYILSKIENKVLNRTPRT